MVNIILSNQKDGRRANSIIENGQTNRGNVESETLYHRDDALLHITYVMLIWAAPFPADRWHCSLWP